MRILIGVVLTLGVLSALAAAGVVYFGLYNVAASDPHWGPTLWVLETARVRSIKAHAAGVPIPADLNGEKRLVAGTAHFSDHCAICHSAPGVEAEDLANGMYPKPPELTHAASHFSPNELFWIVKNGIKMTGMPSWADHGDDELWNTVAFLEKLPGMNAQEYARLVEAAKQAGGHRMGSGGRMAMPGSEKQPDQNQNPGEHPSADHQH